MGCCRGNQDKKIGCFRGKQDKAGVLCVQRPVSQESCFSMKRSAETHQSRRPWLLPPPATASYGEQHSVGHLQSLERRFPSSKDSHESTYYQQTSASPTALGLGNTETRKYTVGGWFGKYNSSVRETGRGRATELESAAAR